MSLHRIAPQAGWVSSSQLPKGPNGRALCRHCGAEVQGRRRTFCSAECVHEWKIRTSPTYVRICCAKRDHGVCAVCGIDTNVLARELAALPRDERILREREAGMPSSIWGACHYWEADHIVPVQEGGGECGLEGYRTLCVPCHHARTAEHRRAAAAKRKIEATGAEQLALPGVKEGGTR